MSEKPRITKHREAGSWRIAIDGRLTSLYVNKGLPPRYREPQMWEVGLDGWGVVLEAHSVSGAMQRLEKLAEELNPKDDASRANDPLREEPLILPKREGR